MGGLVGIVRTGFSLAIIVQNRQSWGTLPFISPLLWADWVSIYNLCNTFTPTLSIIPGIIGACLYVVCFWLCIGYGSLGYGVHQYNVLSVPTQCQAFGPYQTDPRRYYFVCLHVALFGLSTVGLCYGILQTLIDKDSLKLNVIEGQLRRRAGENRTLQRLLDIGHNIHATVGICIFTPAIVGAILAGVVNGHSYLILNRNGCFASYVSGRFGYIDIEFIEWKIKVATWLGVNV